MNPLATLPAVLAQSDLRRQVVRGLVATPPDAPRLAALLALDPLATCVALRSALAPIYGPQPGRWTAARLVATLGDTVACRIVFPAERGRAPVDSLRELWLQSLATACAARGEAARGGGMAPDEAWLLGLLHALPSWLGLLHGLQTGRPAGRTPATALAWAVPLPAELAAASGLGDPAQCSAEVHALLARARDAGATPTAALRDEVTAALRHVGIDLAAREGQRTTATAPAEPPAAPDHGGDEPVDTLALSLLHHADAGSYREIAAALMSAAIVHGRYDRALLARWRQDSGTLVLRDKDDLSPRPLVVTGLLPTDDEAAALRTALGERRPQRLRAGSGAGLLAALHADEAVIVPLNGQLAMPSFLVLDRSLALAPIRLLTDGGCAQTMGLAGTLLFENLLLRRLRDRAENSAQTDGLTALFNRVTGVRILDQELARAARTGQRVAVLLCDLDFFKEINDRFGHLVGDRALRAVAETLRRTARRSDVISRYGGEEFLVALPGTPPAEAAVLAARLHVAIEQRGLELGIPLTISIGMASSQPGDSWESLLQRADQALYASKDRGRNRFASADDGAEDPRDGNKEAAGCFADDSTRPAQGRQD